MGCCAVIVSTWCKLQKSVSGNICCDIPTVSKNPVIATLLVGFSYKFFLFLWFRTTIIVTSSFLDAFQKVADIATGTRGKMRCLPSLSLSLSAVSPHKQSVSPVMIMRKAGSLTSQERSFKHLLGTPQDLSKCLVLFYGRCGSYDTKVRRRCVL